MVAKRNCQVAVRVDAMVNVHRLLGEYLEWYFGCQGAAFGPELARCFCRAIMIGISTLEMSAMESRGRMQIPGRLVGSAKLRCVVGCSLRSEVGRD